MTDLASALIRCIDTRTDLRKYLEDNGSDGSEELANLRQAEAEALSAHDAAVASAANP